MKTQTQLESKPSCVAIYARVSTDEQAKTGDSINTQIQSCTDHVRSIYGQEIPIVVFQDEGKSGSYGPHPFNIGRTGRKYRKGLAAMLTQGKAGEIDAICALAQDRLYRSAGQWAIFRQWCVDSHIQLECIIDPVVDSATGNLSAGILAQVAEFQRKQTSERIQITLDKRKAAGFCLGTPPYGYRYENHEDCVNRRPNVYQIPDEISAVRHIFDLHGQGFVPSQIADKLNAEGVPFNRNSRGPWYAIRVINIIKNRAYTGCINVKERGWVRGLHWEIRVLDEDEFELHLERISGRRRRLKGLLATEHHRYFRKLVRCGVCGHYLESTNDSQMPSYRCYRKAKAMGEKRGHVQVSAAHLQETVLGFVRRFASRPEVIQGAEKIISSLVGVEKQRLEKEQQELTARIASERSRRERLCDALEDGDIDGATYKNRVSKIDEVHRTLRADLGSVERKLASDNGRKLLYERAMAALRDFDGLWDAMSDLERTELLETCIEHLSVRKEGAKLLVSLKLVIGDEETVEVVRISRSEAYDKPEGPEGLTPRQLAVIAHLLDGRKPREAAALMGVRDGQVYRLEHQIMEWLEVDNMAEAIRMSQEWVERNRDALPLYGGPPTKGSHRLLRTMEHQLLALMSSGKTEQEISRKFDVPIEVIHHRLQSAYKKTGSSDPAVALARAKELGLLPGQKTWQWGTHRRLMV